MNKNGLRIDNRSLNDCCIIYIGGIQIVKEREIDRERESEREKREKEELFS